jgi:hypothetical protein
MRSTVLHALYGRESLGPQLWMWPCRARSKQTPSVAPDEPGVWRLCAALLLASPRGWATALGQTEENPLMD